MSSTNKQGQPGAARSAQVDVAIIGAGISGLCMVYRLKELGLSVRGFEAGSGVGGTWHWNRYPGLYCDSESGVYAYSFSRELDQEWTWSTRFPSQDEILRYLDHVADRFDLRSTFDFNTRVVSARYDQAKARWAVETEHGERVEARFVIAAVGCLSAAQAPAIKGLDRFRGHWYHTGQWPAEGVDFAGKRVGVIGTGSSGVQCIPIIAEQADHLTVFQRTPHFVVPAGNKRLAAEEQARLKRDAVAIYDKCRHSRLGHVFDFRETSALAISPEERLRQYEKDWNDGGLQLVYGSYFDLSADIDANDTVADFVRDKIRQIVKNPATAERLIPRGYPIGAKRLVLGTDYYETYNRPNVDLVDLRQSPIEEIVPEGIRTRDGIVPLDILVFATGYDAMTGALTRIDIRGRDNASLAQKWADGWSTYLGVAMAGFPNLFTVTGPGSPSVLSNVPTSIEQHVEWIADCLRYIKEHKIASIEAREEAEKQWVDHVDELAATTLFPRADSWYMGSNISGKPRKFMVYVGGVGEFRQHCARVAERGYEGFTLG